MPSSPHLPKSIEVWVCPKCGSFRGHAGLCRNAMATEHTNFYPDRPDMTGPHRYVLAVPTDEMGTDVWRRFWAKVEPSPDGCWKWTAAKNGNGYGQFCITRTKKVTAHRHLFEAIHGPVEPGLDLDHLCRNRGCVNPAHLEAVSHRENLRRGETGRYERPSTCKHGHELSGDNLFVNSKGHRICRACGRAKTRRRDAKRRSGNA